MARAPFRTTVTNPAGDAVNGASVTFRRRSDNALANVYSAESGGSPVAGSVVATDAAGRAVAWLDRGAYTVSIDGTGITAYSFPHDAVPGGDATLDSGHLSGGILPIGALMLDAGAGDPPGGSWLRCDGRALSRTTYAALFGRIGTTYGAGDGSTTFNLPNLAGRYARSAGTPASGRGAANVNAGTAGGDETVRLTAAQSGTPSHTHPNATISPSMSSYDNGGAAPALVSNAGRNTVRGMTVQGAGGTDAGFAYVTNGSFANAFGVADLSVPTPASSAADAGADHPNHPPFLAVGGYIIRAL